MRVFRIWNRGYNQMTVIAADPAQARQIAFDRGHMRRATMYRRFLDCTDDELAKGGDYAQALSAAMAAGEPGEIKWAEGEGLFLNGKLLTA